MTAERKRASVNSRCLRCGCDIHKGDLIEPMPNWKGKKARYVHVGCTDPHAPQVVADGNGSSIPGLGADAVRAIATDLDLLVRNDLTQEVANLAFEIEQLKSTAEPVRKIIEIKRPALPVVIVDEIVHEAFAEVIDLIEAREEVFLPGPAGCGKSHLAKQAATALGLRFASISCSAGMSESHLLGKMVPIGEQGQFEFVSTEFLDCYENGGVFLFDEIDAADANVLLVVNSALANGHMSVPARREKPVAKRHPDFVCIAAANTFGRGANRLYAGRNQLDEATLDRFRMGTIEMDYNRDMERKLAMNIVADDELLKRLWKYREAVQANRLERIVSTRFILKAYKMLARGWDADKIDSKLFSGWREDEVRKVKGF